MTIGQLIKVRTPSRLKKLSRWHKKTQHSKYSFALTVVLTKKSEPNLNDKYVFPQVRIDVFY